MDFADRCDPRALNKRALENLIAAGAFDTLNPNRRQTFEAAELLLRQAGAAANDRESRQVSLFGGELAEPERLSLPIVPDWPGMEKLRHEFDAIGFYLSAHPLDSYGATLKRLDVVRFADLPCHGCRGRPSVRAKLAGIVIGKQERTSARGSRFAFVQMSDASGMYRGDAVLRTAVPPIASCWSPARRCWSASMCAWSRITSGSPPSRSSRWTRRRRRPAPG